jgi:hypothetical protein
MCHPVSLKTLVLKAKKRATYPMFIQTPFGEKPHIHIHPDNFLLISLPSLLPGRNIEFLNHARKERKQYPGIY